MNPIDGGFVFKIHDLKVHYRALLKRLDRAMSDMAIEKRGRGGMSSEEPSFTV